MSSWIKMGTGLRRHPKTVRIASALNADRLRVVGALHAIWCLFDEHSADGSLPGYTVVVMDEEIGWPGFSAAMADVGWLRITEEGLQVPSYEEHNGPTAKRRALDTKRKAESRGDATPSPESVRCMSALDADKAPTREEEIRKDSSSLRSEERQRATRLPPGWTLPHEWANFCRTERPDLDPAKTAERFADYWWAKPGAQGRKLDWCATWRNWVRNERSPPAAARSGKAAENAAVIDALTGGLMAAKNLSEPLHATGEIIDV